MVWVRDSTWVSILLPILAQFYGVFLCCIISHTDSDEKNSLPRLFYFIFSLFNWLKLIKQIEKNYIFVVTITNKKSTFLQKYLMMYYIFNLNRKFLSHLSCAFCSFFFLFFIMLMRVIFFVHGLPIYKKKSHSVESFAALMNFNFSHVLLRQSFFGFCLIKLLFFKYRRLYDAIFTANLNRLETNKMRKFPKK